MQLQFVDVYQKIQLIIHKSQFKFAFKSISKIITSKIMK